MTVTERRLAPRRAHLKAWDDQMREVFRSVEAAIVREIQPRVCCPRCRGVAIPLGEQRATLEWYSCVSCKTLWTARSAHLT